MTAKTWLLSSLCLSACPLRLAALNETLGAIVMAANIPRSPAGSALLNASAAATSAGPEAAVWRCLCVFDIDRTLTGRQGETRKCPRNRVVRGIHDPAYGGGAFTLSQLGKEGIGKTACRKCYLGIVSAGDAGGSKSKLRRYLLRRVLSSSNFKWLLRANSEASQWTHGWRARSPLTVGVSNERKPDAVAQIREWYKRQGLYISSSDTHFFGDRRSNIPRFRGHPFNAREVSCDSRDPTLYGGSGKVGYCGATTSEIVLDKGIKSCSQAPVAPVPTPPPVAPAPTPSPVAPGRRCLCVFDVDRTLTGRQGETRKCPRNRVVPGIHDPAYGGGAFTLSQLGAEGIARTGCRDCYLGLCSAGGAGGSQQRRYLLEHVLDSPKFAELVKSNNEASLWTHGWRARSPLTVGVSNERKPDAVAQIREWYKRQGLYISSSDTHFFGDRRSNIPRFRAHRFNAREISCDSRDRELYGGSGKVGYCGATTSEIVRDKGVKSCPRRLAAAPLFI